MRSTCFGCAVMLGWLIIAGLAGCASSAVAPAGISVLPKADPCAESLVAYLEARHVGLIKVSGDEVRIEGSEACRKALVQYLGVCQLRMQICIENLANMNALLDSEGKFSPYRRQIVAVGADGEGRVLADDSAFRKTFSPGHPYADANGMVWCPNVDRSVEMVGCRVAAREFSMAVGILRRIDPGIVISEADVTDAFEESD